jgi:hypothetical protein
MSSFRLFSIGYQALASPALLADFDLVIDCRSIPRSRIAPWNQNLMVKALGKRYLWKGDDLGGRPPGIQPAGIMWLETLTDQLDGDAVLVCLEEAPGDCHRLDIAARLLWVCDVLNIYQDHVVGTEELLRAFRENRDYDHQDLRLLRPGSLLVDDYAGKEG